jgi:FkbM family methyltransferase
MAELFDWLVRCFRAWVHVFIPHGRSPESYRRAVRAVHRRLVYDPRMQIVTVRRGALAGARKYGPFCDSDFDFALGKYEPEITVVFDRYCRPGMTAFDIGAHAGYHTIWLAKRCGPSGRVHAFEPVPQNVECLMKTLRLNRLRNVQVHELAVSNREGMSELTMDGVFDGFACLRQGGRGQRERRTGNSQVLVVHTIDLDTFCSRFGITQVDLIKMDIEGAEVLALQGMMRTLGRDRPILIMELWGTEHLAEAPRLLRCLGYEIQTLSVWRGLIQGSSAETANVLAVPSTKI